MRGVWFGVAMVGGWAIGAISIRTVAPRLSRPPHVRTNYRGLPVVGTLGLALAVPLAAGAAAAMVLGETVRMGAAVGGAGVAFGVLGLTDDVWGDRSAGGLSGHLRSLLRGRPTTGALKAGGGAAVGLGVAGALGWRGWQVVAVGAVVALGANLVNLLDLRPGRALKAWIVLYAALWAAAGFQDGVLAAAGLAGGVVAFLPSDLGERGMLGDVGAGIAGGALATAGAASLTVTALVACLAALVALTVASEFVSFSRIIDAVPPLRALDRWGRSPG